MSKPENPLSKISLNILENWALMLADPVDPATPLFDLESPLFHSIVKVDGVVHGELSIVTQQDFLTILAKNLLGIDDEPSQEVCKDAFREMGNVLAGNFITEAYGPDCVFELLNPIVKIISPNDLVSIRSSKLECAFRGDEAPVLMSFKLKPL